MKWYVSWRCKEDLKIHEIGIQRSLAKNPYKIQPAHLKVLISLNKYRVIAREAWLSRFKLNSMLITKERSSEKFDVLFMVPYAWCQRILIDNDADCSEYLEPLVSNYSNFQTLENHRFSKIKQWAHKFIKYQFLSCIFIHLARHFNLCIRATITIYWFISDLEKVGHFTLTYDIECQKFS